MRSLLRRESHSLPVLLNSLAYLKAESRASLLRLERQLGLPARTWVESLLAERLLLAAIMIVALCLIAIRLAPPAVDPMKAAGAGAQP